MLSTNLIASWSRGQHRTNSLKKMLLHTTSLNGCCNQPLNACQRCTEHLSSLNPKSADSTGLFVFRELPSQCKSSARPRAAASRGQPGPGKTGTRTSRAVQPPATPVAVGGAWSSHGVDTGGQPATENAVGVALQSPPQGPDGTPQRGQGPMGQEPSREPPCPRNASHFAGKRCARQDVLLPLNEVQGRPAPGPLLGPWMESCGMMLTKRMDVCPWRGWKRTWHINGLALTRGGVLGRLLVATKVCVGERGRREDPP